MKLISRLILSGLLLALGAGCITVSPDVGTPSDSAVKSPVPPPMPEFSNRLRELLKQADPELKREVLKYRLEWQGWGQKVVE